MKRLLKQKGGFIRPFVLLYISLFLLNYVSSVQAINPFELPGKLYPALCVSFPDNRVGWIGGHFGRIWHTEDGGRTWKTLITGDDVIFNSIAFSPDGHGWVSGEFGVIYASPDSRKWFLQDNGVASQNYTVWHISYIGDHRVIASGVGSLILFKESYKSKWKAVDALKRYNGENSLFRIARFRGVIVAIGLKSIYFCKDPFGPWKRARIEGKLPYGEWLYDIWNNGKRLYVLGVKGSIYYSDDGMEWRHLKEKE